MVEKDRILPRSVLLASGEMPNGETVVKEVVIGTEQITLRITVEGLSRKGIPYFGEREESEDGCVVINNKTALQAIVVDGGTQIERVSTLDTMGLTGGKYIRTLVEQFGKNLNPSLSVETNLRRLNEEIGKDMRIHHPSITHQEHSYNTPYGSIAAVKIDTKNNTPELEIANAGDVFVITVDNENKSNLLTVDDVFKKDQETFATARRLADTYGVSFRETMQWRTTDPHFSEIVEEMQETMRQGNVGIIRRITGASNFDVTSSVSVSLKNISSVFLFTDGGIVPGNSINTAEGQIAFLELAGSSGLQGLDNEIQKRLYEDPDYELYPRFGPVDDLMILKLSFNKN